MSASISMKMSASWEAEKSSYNAVPRMCTVQLTQIILDRPLETEGQTTSLFVVVRMRGSARRVLRSPEIVLTNPKSFPSNQPVMSTSFPNTLIITDSLSQQQIPPGPPLPQSVAVISSISSTPIDFSCTIQYSHLLNRDANVLQILLQRRKKYKNKTMNLGYKNLAYCNVNLSQVLQRRIENRYLDLYSDPNCKTQFVGRVEVQLLSTTPLEKDLLPCKQKVLDEDEDADAFSEESDRGDESDEDGIAEHDDVGQRQERKIAKAKSVGHFKQKVISFLLKKLKLGDPSDEELDGTDSPKLWDDFDLIPTASDIEEEDSDAYGNDIISLRSTPKPSLKPFFATTGGSDDTLGADAGTKLLKRLQRQLVNQCHADATTASDNRNSRTTLFPPINGVKKKHHHALDPIVRRSNQFFRERSSRHPNDSMSGTRLSKRLVHMGRRSLRSSNNKHSATADALKNDDPARQHLPSVQTGSPEVQRQTNISIFQTREVDTSNDRESSDEGSAHEFVQPCTSRQTQPLYYDPTVTSTPQRQRLRNSIDQQMMEPNFMHLDSSRIELGDLQPGSIDKLVNTLFLVNILEPSGQLVIDLLVSLDLQPIPLSTFIETKQLLARLVAEIQGQNRRVSDSGPIKLCIFGGDLIVSFVLRAYVEQLSSRSVELASHFRFYIIPTVDAVFAPSLDSSISAQKQQPPTVSDHSQPDFGVENGYRCLLELTDSGGLSQPTNLIACYLCRFDQTYADLFGDLCYRSIANKRHSSTIVSLVDRAIVYVTNSQTFYSMPIGGCLLSSATQTTPSKTPQKPGFVSEVSADHSVHQSTEGSVRRTVLNEEIHIPFIFCVRLSSDNVPLVSGGPSHSRPDADSSTSRKAPMTNDTQVFSDPEALSEGNKRSVSPELRSHTAAPTSRSQSTFHTSSTTNQSSIDTRFCDLQLEYWVQPAPSSTNPVSGGGMPTSVSTANTGVLPISSSHSSATSSESPHPRRITVKSSCRSLVVTLGSASTHFVPRAGDIGGSCEAPFIPIAGAIPITGGPQLLTLAMWTKEKKQKIMRLGRRVKEPGCKFELIEGIQRLLCTSRGTSGGGSVVGTSADRGRDLDNSTIMDDGNSGAENSTKAPGSLALPSGGNGPSAHSLMRVFIDGVEWKGLKFFQLMPIWRTHVKYFPLATLSVGRPHHAQTRQPPSSQFDYTE